MHLLILRRFVCLILVPVQYEASVWLRSDDTVRSESGPMAVSLLSQQVQLRRL